MEQAIAHIERIRSGSKCSSLFMRFEVGGILLSRCKRNSLKRRSETRQHRVLSSYRTRDSMQSIFPPRHSLLLPLSFSLFLSPVPEHRDTKSPKSTRAPSIRRTRGGKLRRGRNVVDVCWDPYTSFRDSNRWRYREADGTITSQCNSSSWVWLARWLAG